jgi:acetoacetate decarboxylase
MARPPEPQPHLSAGRGEEVLPGRLSKERFGYSMPVDGSYYQSPPFYYRDARSLTVLFETDPEAAADILPEGLELPLPAVASLFIAYYPFTTFGPYHEAILGLACLWQGERATYMPQLATTTTPPLVAGREIWGYAKKIAHIDLIEQDELLLGILERPKGTRLATAVMRRERPVSSVPGLRASISLRVIPSPEEGKPPSLAQLVLTRMREGVVHEAWQGPAHLSFDARSELDPWHRLPVRRVLTAYYVRGDSTLPGGQVIKEY